VVKGTPLTAVTDPRPQCFEVIVFSDDPTLKVLLDQLADSNPELKDLFAQNGGADKSGLIVRVMHVDGEPLTHGFMVEISKYNPA
jgi:hypothetical protein